jgi:hypothetical protein
LEEEAESGPKISVIETLKVIPPPSMLRESKKKQIVEKRIRVRRVDNIEEGKAKINPLLAKELGVGDDMVEIVVAGRKSLQLSPILDEGVPQNEVWVNAEILKTLGIADNTIATIKRIAKK